MNIFNYLHSFVIPYHSNKELLYFTLKLLRETLPAGLRYEIVIVVNNQDEKELELNLQDDVYKIIEINQDILYAKAVNIGVEKTRGDFVTLCDQDIFYLPDWYDELFKVYTSADCIGAVSAKLLNPTNNRIIDFGVAYTPYTSEHPARGLSASTPVASSNRKVQAACSAILMTNRELFMSVGGMDHDMAYLCCDCDYCFKIAEKGFETWVAAKSVVYHKGSSSSQNTKNSRYSYFSVDASNMFYAKCYSKIRYDMKDWICFACKNFKSDNVLSKRYIMIDLSTCFSSEWYFDTIQKELDICIADIYKYNVGMRNLTPIQIYDYVTLNLIDSVIPAIYFVDILGALENNKLWCRLRNIEKDIVIDKNGNIALLSDVNCGNY